MSYQVRVEAERIQDFEELRVEYENCKREKSEIEAKYENCKQDKSEIEANYENCKLENEELTEKLGLCLNENGQLKHEIENGRKNYEQQSRTLSSVKSLHQQELLTLIKQYDRAIDNARTNDLSSVKEFNMNMVRVAHNPSWTSKIIEVLQFCHKSYQQIYPNVNHAELLLESSAVAPTGFDVLNKSNADDDLVTAVMTLKSKYGDFHELAAHMRLLQINALSPNANEAVVAVNALSRIFSFVQKPLSIFVCGYESSGKTSLVESIVGVKLGYSASHRATVCPVIYTFVKKCGTDSEGFYVGDGGRLQPLHDLSTVVEKHMNDIKGPDGKGLSKNVLYITIISIQKFQGTIVDLPGLVEPKYFSEESDQKLFHDAGGNGGFYNSVLSKVSNFESFKNRVKLIFSKNDHGFSFEPDPEKSYLASRFSVHNDIADADNFYSSVLNEFYHNDVISKDDIHFTCMVGLNELYKANLSMEDLEVERDILLANHYQKLLSAFTQKYGSKYNEFEPDNSFDFTVLRESVWKSINKGVLRARDNIKSEMFELGKAVKRVMDKLVKASTEESKLSNTDLIKISIEKIIDAFDKLSNRSKIHPFDLGPPDLRFDQMDEYCIQLHQKFPAKLDLPWNSIHTTGTSKQNLESMLRSMGVTLDYYEIDKLESELNQYIDSYSVQTLNLAGAYRRMVDTLCFRFFSVQIKKLDQNYLYTYLDTVATREQAQNHVDAAQQMAVRIITLVYDQFFKYASKIIRRFFHRSIDIAIYYSRMVSATDLPYVLKYAEPCGTLRAMLLSGFDLWFDEEMNIFTKNILALATNRVGLLRKKQITEFVGSARNRKKGSYDQVNGYTLCEEMRQLLFETVNKHKLQNDTEPSILTETRDHVLSGDEMTEECIAAYNILQADVVHEFQSHWKGIKFHQIFFDTEGVHLEGVLQSYPLGAPAELKYTSWSDKKSIEKRIHVPLSKTKEDMEKYYRTIYGINEADARGSHKKMEALKEFYQFITDGKC